jgi:hypothetical protein
MAVGVTDKRTDLVTLGAADIYFDGVDVGHVKGTVQVAFPREFVAFKPAKELGNVMKFIIREEVQVRCTSAELKLANIKLALGITTAITPSFEPSGVGASHSWTVDTGEVWDSLTFGGAKELDDLGLRIEHTRPNGNKIEVILYRAQCTSEFNIDFNEEDISMPELLCCSRA